MGLRNGEVSGRWQGSKALAGAVIAVRRDGNARTRQALGEEGDSRGKNISTPGRQPKAHKPSGVCLALALPGERVDKTERRKGRKHQQGNQKQEREGEVAVPRIGFSRQRSLPAGRVHAGSRESNSRSTVGQLKRSAARNFKPQFLFDCNRRPLATR